MRRLACLALLAALAAPAAAQTAVANRGGDSVRITMQPCPAEVLATIPEPLREKFRAAQAVVDGKRYVACWALRVDGMVHIQYADGEAGLVPRDDFQREREAPRI